MDEGYGLTAMTQSAEGPGVLGPAAIGGRARNILVVDDSHSVRSSLRANLENHGYAVCEAVRGLDGIAKAKELKPDLIILDLVMPEMNGIEVASVLKRIMPEIPLVLLTIYGDDLGKSLAPVFGIKAVLSKSDGIGPLLECISSLVP
jgi:CheY-like chemotaxis protein